MKKIRDIAKNPNFLLMLAFLAAGGVLALALTLASPDGARVEVRVGGEVTRTYPLTVNRTVTIEGANGGTNVLVIQNGTARVTEASCPDGLCIHMGAIRRTGQSIVCLPNRVVVEIVDESAQSADGEVDVIAK